MDYTFLSVDVAISVLFISLFMLLLGVRALARNFRAYVAKTDTLLTGLMVWEDNAEEVDGKTVIVRRPSGPFSDAIKAAVQESVSAWVKTLPTQLPTAAPGGEDGLSGMIMQAVPKKYQKNPLLPILIEFGKPFLNKIAGGALGGGSGGGGGLPTGHPFQ